MADDRNAGMTTCTAPAPGDGVPICPLTQTRCMGEWCAWHVTYAGGTGGCVAAHVADALVEVSYQLTLG